MRKHRIQNRQAGFTLLEVIIATVVLLVGVVAVAQLVPSSIALNAANRYNSSALAFAQRELDQMLDQPLAAGTPSFTDAQGFTCNLGDSSSPNTVVGSPVIVVNNTPVIDFTAATVTGYNETYADSSDSNGVTYDVRWAVITNANATSKRFLVGAQKRGGDRPEAPVTLDVMVEK
jgi:prepilin-type N-terminal cleavage/methylation domain-containing protein